MSVLQSPGYESLANVLHRAFQQAADGKGAERHANALPFDQQPMQSIAQKHGVGFLLGQADKKTFEAHGMVKRQQEDRAVHELLGAINYLAGAIIFIEGQAQNEDAKPASPDQTDAPKEKPQLPIELIAVLAMLDDTDDL